MLEDEVTVLLNTCDSFSDCWYPFFKLWSKFFPDHSLKIILNTETKDFTFDGLNIENLHLFRGKEKPSFGEQMNAYLDYVDTPFVLTMLDDFFLNKPVDIKRIERCIDFLKSTNDAAQIYFTSVIDDKNFPVKGYEEYVEKNHIAPYKVNTMGGIWKKDMLKKYSIDKATPWEWEVFGTILTFDTKDRFFAQARNVEPIMSYKRIPEKMKEEYNYPQLWGIVRGKWVVESVDELFKENGIDIDYSVRGVLTKELLKETRQTKLSVPLEELVGERIAKDIKKYERNKLLKQKLHLPYDNDYIEYRERKEKSKQ